MAVLAGAHRRYWSKLAEDPDRLAGEILKLLGDHRLAGEILELLGDHRLAGPTATPSVSSLPPGATASPAVASWNEPWASAWAEDMVRSGNVGALDGHAVNDLTVNVRRLLDRLDQAGPPRLSRTELASALYGSAHALDRGRSLTTAIERALRHRTGSLDGRQLDGRQLDGRQLDGRELDGRELWEEAGILTDRVSAPALTWSLPAVGTSPLDEQIRAASAGALPVHISLLALRAYPVTVPRHTPVLVVENPRLVEAAAERNRRSCVVATNGNPSTAVTTLPEQLRRSGASLHYHGDFDSVRPLPTRQRSAAADSSSTRSSCSTSSSTSSTPSCARRASDPDHLE